MKKGFTIIETTLVVSISALLAVGMMIGWNINITRQRYNDSVNTLKSDIQGIFNEVENPSNPRSNTVSCTDDGTNVQLAVSGNVSNAGATNCIILGKMVTFGDNILHTPRDSNGNIIGYNQLNQTKILVYDIIGLDIDPAKACGGPCTNSLEALKATKFVINAGKNKISNPRVIEVSWDNGYKVITDNRESSTGTHLFEPDTSRGTITSQLTNKITTHIGNMMILRSPIDGSVMTFGVPTPAVGDDQESVNQSIALFRHWSMTEGLLVNNSKTINMCVRNLGANRWLSGETIFGRNRVIKIGNTSASVEIAVLNGPNGSSCDNRTGFDGVIIDGVAL